MEPVITPPPPFPPKIKISSLFLGILIGIVLTFVFLFTIFAYTSRPSTVTFPTTSLPTRYPAEPSITPAPTPVITAISPGAVSWLNFPKVVKLSVYLSSTDSMAYLTISSALQTATFADGSKLVNATIVQEGPGTPYIERYLISPSGQIYYLSAYNGTNSYTLANLKPDIKISDFTINGINAPDLISTSKGNFVRTSLFMNDIVSFTQLKNPQFLIDSDYGRFYVTYEPKKNLAFVSQRQLWLRLKDDTLIAYDPKISFMTDNQVPVVTWTDNTKNTQAYNVGFRGGCGQTDGKVIRPGPKLGNLTESGSTSGSQPVYKLTDPNSPILKYIYTLLVNGDVPGYDNFVKSNYYFLWQDSLSDWVIFISQANQVMAECGKPVIYLYPTTDTNVSVKVGANITKSEPLYPQNGWTVLAHPNGQLDYQGRSYPNLFWEGTGHGVYKDIANYGFVVPQSQLISTLKNQLSQLGLTSRESSDFMDFWTDKLPTTPYVRLTWLDTADMNNLAPLQVSPPPQTTIRIFLDFAGLDKSVKLIPQKLTSPPRSGFTLIEWGGLLVK